MEFLLAAVLAVVATPVAMLIARRTGVVDRPGPLKTHTRPVAYLGGVAVFVALLVGVGSTGRWELALPLGLALALGTVDDVHPLPPTARLALEVVVALVAAVVVPGAPVHRLLTAGLLVVLVNAVNLLDGQDGLAGAVGAVAALGFALLGGDATAYGLALAGALAGFLVFNRPPARIYLGDGGAYLLGAALALAPALTHDAAGWSVWFATPLLVAMPLLDTAVAFWRRLREHRPLFAGDRGHVYDQLVDRGRSVAASTGWCALAQVLLTAVGVLVAGLAAPVALGCTAVTVVVAAWAVHRLRFV